MQNVSEISQVLSLFPRDENKNNVYQSKVAVV